MGDLMISRRGFWGSFVGLYRQPASYEAAYKYIAPLDGLRSVSIFLVMVEHFGFGNIIPGASFGVTLFFFISGFLITRLFIAENAKSGTISLKDFYIRRFLRLAPALMFLVVLSSILYYIAFNKVYWMEILSSTFYFANYYKTVVHLFNMPLGILWSIAVEEHYYVFFPILFYLFIGNTKGFLKFLFFITLAVMVWRGVLYAGSEDKAWLAEYIARATDTRVDSIIFGAILSLILNSDYQARWTRFAENPIVFCLACVLLLMTLAINGDAFRLIFRFSIQGCALMVVVSAILCGPKYAMFRLPLSLGPVVWVGKLSYSLYLWHYACEMLVRYCYPGMCYQAVAVWGVGASFVMAMISYYGIERRTAALRKRFGSHLSR